MKGAGLGAQPTELVAQQNIAARTHTGHKRKLNQDNYCIDEALGLVVVADGMGGHSCGEIASQEAVRLIHEYLQQHQNGYVGLVDSEPSLAVLEKIVVDAVHYAGTTLYGMNEELGYGRNKGMGTTVVGAWGLQQFNTAIIFHVGDSRAYLHRGALTSRLTKDHSLYQHWLDHDKKGPEPSQSVILQALGLSETLTVETRQVSLISGDLILLCSDGLTGMLCDSQIQACLAQIPSEPIDKLCAQLVQKANMNGGKDNVTVAIGQFT